MKAGVYQDPEISPYFLYQLSQKESLNLKETAAMRKTDHLTNRFLLPVPVLVVLVLIFGLLLELNLIESTQEAIESSG